MPLISHVSPEDFPRLLQLQEEISNPDESAKYILAFAPRLDGELIREAIRRLEGVTFDTESAWYDCYLLPLALRSVQLGLVSEALESIERCPDAEGKIHALSTICSQLPVDTFERVESIARGITNGRDRCQALCAIAPLAPDPYALRAEALQEAEKDHTIIGTLMVLATDWKDEFRKESLWERATENWPWIPPPYLEYLSRALNLCAPDQCESAISLSPSAV